MRMQITRGQEQQGADTPGQAPERLLKICLGIGSRREDVLVRRISRSLGVARTSGEFIVPALSAVLRPHSQHDHAVRRDLSLELVLEGAEVLLWPQVADRWCVCSG